MKKKIYFFTEANGLMVPRGGVGGGAKGRNIRNSSLLWPWIVESISTSDIRVNYF